MHITNLNGSDEIGASGWMLDFEGHRLLLDAGIDPKKEGRDALPLYAAGGEEDVDAIVISHCHHDHVGSLPVALRQWPSAQVMMTELSYFIVERVLHNSVNVMKRQRREFGITDYPLYSHREVDDIAPVFQGLRYNREVAWGAPHKHSASRPSPTLEFYDAGHTLGSAGVMIRGTRETVFYTGDVSFRDQTLLKGARFEDVQADVLIMETTRGSRATPENLTRAGEMDRLLAGILEVLERKGSVLLPTFALGRTQEMLAQLALWMKSGQLKRQPVYIGGLGRVFTEIYDLQAHRTHRQHSNLMLHEALQIEVLEARKLDAVASKSGRIYVVTAGMMSENTTAHELAVRMAGDERHGIFFVGYADPSTPGGRMKAASANEPFYFSSTAGELTRRCDMFDFDLTAHANREELLDFVDVVSPRVVVLGHGDPDARQWFADSIRQRHPRIQVLQPGAGEKVEAA